MPNTHLIISDPHAHYQYNNNRATWISKLIADLNPDVVVNTGDQWDMPSLSSYDKGKKSFQGRTYKQDINAGLDFSDRLWTPLRKRKKKLPRRVFLIGNHEERIDRAIQLQPELDGVISYGDLDLDRDYHDIVHYDGRTPGIREIDGVYYAHYFVSGVLGKPISSINPARALLGKGGVSATCGHSHLTDFATSTGFDGTRRMGLVAGCAIDYWVDWPGSSQSGWWRGVIIKRNVENGCYDPEWVSMERLKREYGGK